MANCDPKKDCLRIPFPPECFDFCIEQILRVARPEDKTRILGMDEGLAEAIFHAYNYPKSPIRSFDDLTKVLSEVQVNAIRLIFNNLTQKQLDYFINRL